MFRVQILSLITLLAYSSTAHGDSIQSAANRYNQYVSSLESTTDINSLNHFLSADTLNARSQYIERLQSKKNKTRSEVDLVLLERAKYSEKCVTNRQFLNSATPSADTIILSYRFEDLCANNPEAIVATIADVTMIKQDGLWKIDMVSLRPEKPVKIRKVIELE